jgi:hypothetical protein
MIKLAREADFEVLGTEFAFENFFYSTKELFHFAELVAAAEREACALVVEEWLHGEWHNQGVVAAMMIRARGQHED